MTYKPKIVTGTVKDTGYPIDGRVLYFSLWDYDNHENWHLCGWENADDEAVMITMYQSMTESGLCDYDTLEDFTEAWKAKKWEAPGSFCLELDKVDVVEVIQEEQKDDTREKLREYGIDLSPRKGTDRGGILCLPLDKNLNGDTQAAHPDWELIECPHCGRKCWKQPEADRLIKEQRAQALCTQCALEAGLVSPYRQNNTPKPGGNRAQRRRAERETRKGKK